MTIQEICLKVTGKPIGTYIDHGFYVVTRTQAQKLCYGKLPRPGHEKVMRMDGDTPAPSFTTSTHEYIISETHISCRTDIASGSHWAIRAF